jgi:hypothetical protein
MSVGGISGNLNAMHWQNHTRASVTGSAAASGATDAVANTGSVTAGNMASFFKSFSSDLQSMLSQSGNTAGSGTTTQTAANQPLVGTPQHRHPHPEGGGGPMQRAASQMTAQIGQGPGGGALSARGISNSASVFAADAMQALKAYGATA